LRGCRFKPEKVATPSLPEPSVTGGSGDADGAGTGGGNGGDGSAQALGNADAARTVLRVKQKLEGVAGGEGEPLGVAAQVGVLGWAGLGTDAASAQVGPACSLFSLWLWGVWVRCWSHAFAVWGLMHVRPASAAGRAALALRVHAAAVVRSSQTNLPWTAETPIDLHTRSIAHTDTHTHTHSQPHLHAHKLTQTLTHTLPNTHIHTHTPT
jgi:hypothetical protein